MDDDAQALRAGNGWRVHATHGEHTFWRRSQSLWGKESVGYCVTKGEVPDAARGGNGSLSALASMKKVPPAKVVPAEGARADVRAVRDGAGGEDGPWRGMYRSGEEWAFAPAPGGEPADHASPDEAREAALACLEDLAPAGPGRR